MAITSTRYAIVNGYNLNSVPGLSVYALDLPGSNRSLNINSVARKSARKVSSAYYQNNTLLVNVYISATTRDLLEQSMDTLLSNIQTQEGSIVVPKSGNARQYTATYESYTVNNNMSNTNSPIGNTADLTLVFECSDSHGYDQFFTPMFNQSGLTSGLNTWNWTFIGSGDNQTPYLSFYFTGGSVGSGTVVIGNQNTGEAITITRVWNVGDTLAIDSRYLTVQVNGVDTQFTGAFPTFALGLQTIYYQDNFTSRVYTFYAYIFNRYY